MYLYSKNVVKMSSIKRKKKEIEHFDALLILHAFIRYISTHTIYYLPYITKLVVKNLTHSNILNEKSNSAITR